MTQSGFAYKVILKRDDLSTVTSMVAYQAPGDRPLRAVIWSVPRSEWIFAPALVSRILFDQAEQERGRTIDRETAERISREALRTELPSEARLTALSDEGERHGWNFGPPQT